MRRKTSVCAFLPFAVVCSLLYSGSATQAAINLVPNGDFELGNSLFGSDYEYRPADNSSERQYTVRSNPYPWNPAFLERGDHTTGTGMMFVGNGSPNTNDRVWYMNGIAVLPDTDYFFEAFVMNVIDATKYSPGADPATFSVLSFYANDMLLGTRTTSELGVWQGLSTQWNSGASTTANLKILNSNPINLGNDFAMDDIYLGVNSIVNQAAVPEPTTLTCWLLGSLAIFTAQRSRRQRSIS